MDSSSAAVVQVIIFYRNDQPEVQEGLGGLRKGKGRSLGMSHF